MSGEQQGMAAALPPDQASSSRDGLIALAIAALVAGTVLIGSLGAPAPHPPVAAKAAIPENDPACMEWGDGCHVCRRGANGPACSLPGIACTPGPDRCLKTAHP